MDLNMPKLCWLATGGGTVQLQETKLSWLHFLKDNNSRMDVALALELMSGSCARMMRKAIDDDSITLGDFRNKHVFKSFVVFIEKWDRLVDIMNARDGVQYTPENGRAIQEELLKLLTWLTNWHNDHEEAVKQGMRTEYNFFADETWKCMQMLLLGHVSLIQLYCINRGMTIDPRAINTDPVEHHFGNGRQMVGGSTNSMTTSAWGHSDAKSGLAKTANYSNVGNNRHAEDHFNSKIKAKF